MALHQEPDDTVVPLEVFVILDDMDIDESRGAVGSLFCIGTFFYPGHGISAPVECDVQPLMRSLFIFVYISECFCLFLFTMSLL